MLTLAMAEFTVKRLKQQLAIATDTVLKPALKVLFLFIPNAPIEKTHCCKPTLCALRNQGGGI
jgi:hypothetical protein